MVGSEVDDLDDGKYTLEIAGGGGCHHDPRPPGTPEPDVGRCNHDPEPSESQES